MGKTVLHLTLIFALIFLCCNNCDSEYHFEPPLDNNDGINTGILKNARINTAMIAKAIKKIKNGSFNEIHSILIFKDNMLVLEEYFEGHKYQYDAPGYFGEYVQWNKDMIHPIMSCTKSFTSTCFGIAIDKGYIKSVHQKIFDYLPDHQRYNNDGKENITIEHLLTMTSGLAWDEWGVSHGTSANDIDRLYFECSDDPIKCVLERDLIYPPGEVFTYSGGGMVILGEILRNATNMNIDVFSKKYLFQPLGIDTVNWTQYNNGVFATDGSMYITPRAMLKFGVMYLNKGYWDSIKILPDEWIAKSSEIYNNNKQINIPIEDSGKNGYGYSWWIRQLDYKGDKTKMYRANGWGGQTIMVFPDLNMVIVFTGGNYASKSKLFKFIERFILPSIE